MKSNKMMRAWRTVAQRQNYRAAIDGGAFKLFVLAQLSLCKEKKIYHTFENLKDNTSLYCSSHSRTTVSTILSMFKMADSRSGSAHALVENRRNWGKEGMYDIPAIALAIPQILSHACSLYLLRTWLLKIYCHDYNYTSIVLVVICFCFSACFY
jgi:hypothetical protein